MPEAIVYLRNRISDVRTSISRSRQTFLSVVALLTGNLSSSVLAAIGGFLVARFLGPEETGSFRAYTIPMTYLMFLHLGTWDGLWRQIPFYVGREMPEKVRTLASAGGFFNLLVSIGVSCGLLFYAAFCLIHDDLQGFAGWLSQAFYCWVIFYGGYLSATFRTLQHFVTLSRIQICQSLLSFGLVFSLPFFGFYGLCARVALPSLLGAFLFHIYRPLRVPYKMDTGTLWELMRIGLPFSFWGTLYSSGWTAMESTLVLSFCGTSSLGLFSVATMLAGALNSLPLAIWQVFTPRVIADFAQDGSIRKANARIIWVTAGTTGFMTVLAFAGSPFLDVIVPNLIPKYVAGIPVMKLCLWFPVVQAAFLPMNALAATGRPWLYGRSVIAGIIVFAFSTYMLLPLIGGLLAVVAGSLFGRAARTLAAYVDLFVLARSEA